MVFDGQVVVFYIGLLLFILEVQSIISNPIFITKKPTSKAYPLRVSFLQCLQIRHGLGLAPRKSTRNEKNNQSCNAEYLFQPHNGLLLLNYSFYRQAAGLQASHSNSDKRNITT